MGTDAKPGHQCRANRVTCEAESYANLETRRCSVGGFPLIGEVEMNESKSDLLTMLTEKVVELSNLVEDWRHLATVHGLDQYIPIERWDMLNDATCRALNEEVKER